MNPDIHALSGAYAVDSLDDLERARFEAHLADCAACLEEVASLVEAAGLLGATAATEPPAGLRDRVLADIATVRPLPPVAPVGAPVATPAVTPAVPRHVVRRRRLPALLAAAAAIVVLGTGVTVWHPWQDDTTHHGPSAADRVIQAADVSKQTVSMSGGVEMTLYRSASLGRAVLTTQNMPSPPSGKVYELWLQNPAGQMEPAGLMPVAANQKILLDGDAKVATAAGITVEPEGGSPAPTTDPIALFDFKESV
jgi:anti-sigma factor RsiW